MQDRDLELLICEAITPDGCAVMKAFSTPMGMVVPMDPTQTRYVRAAVLLSGVLARPLRLEQVDLAASLPLSLRGIAQRDLVDISGGARKEYCVVEYLGLVHPMGMIPPVLTNMVISAQVSVLNELQRYIAGHTISSARPLLSPAMPMRKSGHEFKNDSHSQATPTESSPSVSTNLEKTYSDEASAGLLKDAMGTTSESTPDSHEASKLDDTYPNSRKSASTCLPIQNLLPGGLSPSATLNCDEKLNNTVAAVAENHSPTSTDIVPSQGESRLQRTLSVTSSSNLSLPTSTDDSQKKGKTRFWRKYVKKSAISKL
ncbi:unnamed protein product [Phytomonas sp. Hart1]|nr:unnamed protein product [Phytomonas sp. Hart1]|eukprot:CCW65988.1 unnamed protein product [Phytomonas sp. isolate Hart1]